MLRVFTDRRLTGFHCNRSIRLVLFVVRGCATRCKKEGSRCPRNRRKKKHSMRNVRIRNVRVLDTHDQIVPPPTHCYAETGFVLDKGCKTIENQRLRCTLSKHTSGRPPTNPSSTDTSGKNTRSTNEHSVVPTIPLRPLPLPPPSLLLAPPPPPPSSTAIRSKIPCPSVDDERGGGGKSSRVRHIRRRAAVSWKRTQRSPAEELTRRSPVPGQGKIILARGCRRKRCRAPFLHRSRASAVVVLRSPEVLRVFMVGGMRCTVFGCLY